jgi:hypothetical protein
VSLFALARLQGRHFILVDRATFYGKADVKE